MRDWKAIVRCRIGRLRGVDPTQQEEVISELAEHLEDVFEEHRAQGLSESAATDRSLRSVGEWSEMVRGIRHAKGTGNRMNDRTKQLWFPSLVSLSLANAVLMALGKMSLQPHAVVARSLSWYPGVSLMLTYVHWLAMQPVTGAIGAYLSYRAGGDRRARLVAGLFPSIVMLGLWCVLIPASEIFARNRFVMLHPVYFALGAVGWVLVPGMALLFGALPFLTVPKVQES